MRMAQGGLLIEQEARPLLIEGYASIFGHEDLTGDVVRACLLYTSPSPRD